MPARLFAVRCTSGYPASRLFEDMAMAMDVGPSQGKITCKAAGLADRKGHSGAAGVAGLKLVVLPVLIIVGLSAWMILAGPSDAESHSGATRSPVIVSAQNTSWFNPAITPTEANVATPVDVVTPVEETVPAEAPQIETVPVDGLKISSQSWRRGGLGSKALVTFTLRNRNDYAVRNIEIACAFTRKDGTHLTDRRRTIHDTVNTRSRRTFARMLVGFVNISANRAKCALVTASRT
jgi:hypothetical protein